MINNVSQLSDEMANFRRHFLSKQKLCMQLGGEGTHHAVALHNYYQNTNGKNLSSGHHFASR